MNTFLLKSFPIFCLFFFVTSCTFDKLDEPAPVSSRDPLNIIHLAHTRMNTNEKFNPQLTQVDYSVYDLRLLGGDLAVNTSIETAPLDSLDQVFDLANENTLWALGNHDYDDLALVEAYTKRPPFYSFTKDAITFLVLDTQDSLSSILGDQLTLVESVLDTITHSTHLVLLHHKLIWMYGNDALQGSIGSTANGGLGDCFWCINPNNFYTAVYPKLLDVESRGIEVLCIGGDFGYHTKTYHYETAEGIDFLGSGMDLDEEDNTVLLLEYDFASAQLTWTFDLLKNL